MSKRLAPITFNKLPLAASFTIRLILAIAVSGGIYWATRSQILLVLTLPLWGLLLAQPIVESLERYFDFARKQPYRKWQGHYYAFQSRHIRIYEIDDALWFCDADILKVVDKKPESSLKLAYSERDYLFIEGENLMVFSETAVFEVISRIRHAEVGKLKFWLEREVMAPFHNKKKLKI